jgi:DNA-binding CsgD family transcriptional regulator
MIEPDAAILDALYQGAFDIASLERAVELIASRFGCRSAAMVSVDSQAPATGAILVVGIFKTAIDTYLSRYAPIDPAPAAFARLPVGKASTTRRILNEDDHRSRFVMEFYYPLGLVETLGGNLVSDNARSALIGINRGPDRPPFTDEDIADLERLMPHVTRALQMRRAIVRLEAKAAGLPTAVDRLAAGVLLLDSAGTGVFANRAMHEIAARDDGLSLDRAGRPLPASHDGRRGLGELIQQVRYGRGDGAMMIPRKAAGEPYSLLVVPSPTPLAEGVWDRSPRATTLIIVHDPEGRIVNASDVLRASLGLTPSAARLVAALAGGDDLKSFAEREGVTIHTARYHLRTALARTGTRSQADLVRLAVSHMRDLGLRAQTPSGEVV